MRKQALESLEENAGKAEWDIEEDIDGSTATKKTKIEVNGISIPVIVSVSGGGIMVSRKDDLVEMEADPPGAEAAGISPDEVEEFAEAYMREYEKFDWDPILEWAAESSDLDVSANDAMYDYFEYKNEPQYGYYDLRGRG